MPWRASHSRKEAGKRNTPPDSEPVSLKKAGRNTLIVGRDSESIPISGPIDFVYRLCYIGHTTKSMSPIDKRKTHMTRFLVPATVVVEADTIQDAIERTGAYLSNLDAITEITPGTVIVPPTHVTALCDQFEGDYSNPDQCDDTATHQYDGGWYCEKHYQRLVALEKLSNDDPLYDDEELDENYPYMPDE